MATFGASPMPNQMMNSAIRPTNGTVRSICTGASTRSSPILNRPETRASPVPTTVPSSSPNATRCSEVPMAEASEPSPIRSPATCAIRPGEARTSDANTPVELRSCHRASSRRGPAVRRSQRGTRVRREEAGTMGVSSRDAESRESTLALFDEDIGEMSGSEESGGAWLMLMGAPWEESVRRGRGPAPQRRHVTRSVRVRRGTGNGGVRKGEKASAAAATRGRGHPQQVDVTARGEHG